ncbi:MAG TPA: FAD-binding oxidoreductase [Nitrososphaeraceae archaeon]|nr:FAD-binding oxidoreductase [Nitrososphaeraceae archaeon]
MEHNANMDTDIEDELERVAKGEVLSDDWNKKVYSVDASHYSIEPSAIVYPLDEYDLSRICQYGYSKNISITARGAGTGLLGQSLNSSIILDFTKHMNKILEIGADYVLVQPGLVKGVLDKELRKRGKFLPPDPASSNYCTVGGMIANNSSGVHALGYGNTIEFLDMVNVVYSNGSFGCVRSRDNISSNDERITKLYSLLSSHIDLIQTQYPKVTKNSCGYRLDAVINDDGFHPHKIFAASEGTLGIVTSAKLKIFDIPLYQSTMVFGFKDLLSAISAVPVALKFSPVALEVLDHTVFRNFDVQAYPKVKDNVTDRGTLLFAEFAGNSLKGVEQRVTMCKDKLSPVSKIIEAVTDENSSRQIWGARKSALNNALKMTVGSRKPVGLIEDTVVNPNMLYDYTRFLLQKYNDNKLDYVIYGHAGNGNLHTRPLIDTESRTELELFNIVGDEVFAKVISCGGTITGEHGDGIARSKYIKLMYGTQLVSIFEKIKKMFDPKCTMNPGKKVIRSDT